MVVVTEVKLVRKAGLSGRIKVDDFFINRGMKITRGLSIRLELSEIEKENPKFDIEVDHDYNTVCWSRKDQASSSDDEVRITAYFDLLVDWPTIK